MITYFTTPATPLITVIEDAHVSSLQRKRFVIVQRADLDSSVAGESYQKTARVLVEAWVSYLGHVRPRVITFVISILGHLLLVTTSPVRQRRRLSIIQGQTSLAAVPSGFPQHLK